MIGKYPHLQATPAPDGSTRTTQKLRYEYNGNSALSPPPPPIGKTQHMHQLKAAQLGAEKMWRKPMSRQHAPTPAPTTVHCDKYSVRTVYGEH